MSDQKKQERKWVINKNKVEVINTLLDTLGILGSVIGFLCKIILKFEFPKIVFIAVFVLIFCYGFKFLMSIIRAACKNIKKYFCKSDCLYRESKNDEEKKKELYYEIRKLRKKVMKEFLRYVIPRFFRSIIASILIIALCLINPLNAKAFWKDMQEIAIIIFEQPSEDVSEKLKKRPETDETENDNSTESTEDERERKPPGYRFILTHPDKIFDLDNQIEAQVYFYNGDTTKPSSALLTTYISDLKENRKTGLNIEDKMYDEENEFKLEVAEYKDIEYIDDWYEVAPSSDKLDDYIQKREQVNNVMIDGKQGCYELWWRLANDYQYYAQEYEMQTNNETAVLYYYTMSIYCCMRALEYEMNDQMYNMIYHYMAMRYHDIYRDECIVSSTYKKWAEIIYFALEPEAKY